MVGRVADRIVWIRDGHASDRNGGTQLDRGRGALAELRAAGATWQVIRKAEVDWFGAAETVTLARVAPDGRLEATAAACLPAEIQAMTVGRWAFAAWPGELFVEYGLAAKREQPGFYVISLANGEL